MKTIWKWTLFPERTDISMPEGTTPLTVQEQNGEPQLWALVDPNPELKLEVRTFTIYDTGHGIPDHVVLYIGTFQLHDGALVFHVFEET